jgi:hypothetical protein
MKCSDLVLEETELISLVSLDPQSKIEGSCNSKTKTGHEMASYDDRILQTKKKP